LVLMKYSRIMTYIHSDTVVTDFVERQ
jgi:hypothetical protein